MNECVKVFSLINAGCGKWKTFYASSFRGGLIKNADKVMVTGIFNTEKMRGFLPIPMQSHVMI